MFNLRLLQDLNLENADLRKQYYSKFVADDIEGAFRILSDNPQIASQVLTEENLNALVNALLTLENFYQIGVTDFLQNKLNEFQIDINNLIYIGQFLPTKTYVVNNFVMYQGRIFYCYRNTVAGILPTNESYWINLGLKGESGNAAMGVIYKGVWSASTSYSALDMVLHADNLYVARTANSNKNPTTSTADWFLASEFKTSIIHVSIEEPIDWKEGEIWFKLFKPYPNILWERTPARFGHPDNHMAFLNDIFLTYGGYGESTHLCAISNNGLNWKKYSCPIDLSSTPICSANQQFVAMETSHGNSTSYTSTNGIIWIRHNSFNLGDAYQICYGNGLFIVLPSYGKSYATSIDGKTWTVRTFTILENARYFELIAHGNGTFVILHEGDSDTGCMTSQDGITWESRRLPQASGDGWRSICYGNGVFVVTGYEGSIITSTDGITWIVRMPPMVPIGQVQPSCICTCWGDGIFVSLRGSIYEYSGMLSEDGKNWTRIDIPNTEYWGFSRICYGNGMFVTHAFEFLSGKIEKV